MKSFITSLSMVAMLSSLALGAPGFNDVLTSKDKTKIGGLVPAKPSPVLEQGTKVGDLKPPILGGMVIEAFTGLEIKQVSAQRDANRIIVTGLLQSTAKTDVAAGWTLMKAQGASWINLRKGVGVVVPAKGTKLVTIELPATNEALRFRWAVSWTKPTTSQTAKEFTLAVKEVNYVVHYMTQNGGWANVLDGNFGEEFATYHAQRYRMKGFETQIALSKNTVGPENRRQRVYVRLQSEQIRKFDTEKDATWFIGSLRAYDYVSNGKLFTFRITQE